MQETYKKIHLNKPQLQSYLIQAFEEYAVWGRGTGKSEGLIAPRARRNILDMPRGTGVFVGSTYQQLLTRTLPPVILGLERLGWRKDYHYFIGRKPPATWRWPEAYRPPLKHDYFISFYNGAGIHLVSQDRPGTSNGLSIDWIIGDEAKLLNKKKLDSELFPTNRGNRQYFGHLPHHHSMLFCTDMPTTPQAKWILEKEQEMSKERINLILSLSIKLEALILEQRNFKDEKNVQKYQVHINKIKRQLGILRQGSVYYSEFSSLENIAVLGEEYIKQMRRALPDLEFQTSILGKRMFKVENGFYSMLDQEKHTYDAFNYSYIDGLDYDFNKIRNANCLADSDLLPAPIDIALDYGGQHNFLVAGQEHDGSFKFINSMFVKTKHKQRLQDLIDNFCKYYSLHLRKRVNYYYDHTAVGVYQGAEESCFDIVCNQFIKNGWEVNPLFIGQAPSHRSRFNLWQYAFSTDQSQYPIPLFNRENAKYLIMSMDQAQVVEGKDGFQKDKRSEKKEAVPQEESTHLSDAADTLYWGKYSHLLNNSGEFFDTSF